MSAGVVGTADGVITKFDVATAGTGASAWVGLTLPGMIDEPGSLAGMINSANPALGPHDIHWIETKSARLLDANHASL